MMQQWLPSAAPPHWSSPYAAVPESAAAQRAERGRPACPACRALLGRVGHTVPPVAPLQQPETATNTALSGIVLRTL